MNARNSIARSAFALALAVGVAAGSLVFIAGCPSVPPPSGNGNGDTNGGTNGEPTASKFVGADTCMPCHSGMHTDWMGTAHANALDSLEAIGQGENGECLGCHTVGFNDDGFVNRAETPALAGVQCENCHGPAADHAASPGDLSLRPTVDLSAALCGACHTQEEAMLGDTPHHPQIEMLTGIGAFQADGTALEQTHIHSVLATAGGEACAQCHVVRHEVEEPNEGNPNVTGHTFNPFDLSITAHQADQYTGCRDCHTDAVADALRVALQTDLSARLDALAPVFDSTSASFIDSETLSAADQTRLASAKFNFQFVGADGSRGVHNPALARGALDVAEQIINDLTGQ